jgi:hypothetical protein
VAADGGAARRRGLHRQQTAQFLHSIEDHRLYAGYRLSGFVFTNLNRDPMAPTG